MTPNEYQKMAQRTNIKQADFTPSAKELMIIWASQGLFGEAGEIAELIKKGIFHQHGLNKGELALELGDLLWYVAALCSHTGLDLEDVMLVNIAKLKKRYPDGWDVERSKHS